MNIPRPTLQKELKGEEKELGDDITNLQKKVRRAWIPRIIMLINRSEPRRNT